MTPANLKSKATYNIARTFVDARQNDGCIATYPGQHPTTLDEAYAIQNDGIALMEQEIVGWKAGGIGEPWASELGVDRLIGPVFKSNLRVDDQTECEVPVFARGFAAFEGEVTAKLGCDVPNGKTDFSLEDTLNLVDALHFGVEIASSPFEEINEHGPLVTITDFGNNNGLILGEEIPDWRTTAPDDWVFETVVNGRTVGKATPTGMRGGPLESVRYCLELNARRGHTLKAGTLILTGAVTGVHRGYPGDTAIMSCAGVPSIACKLVAYA